MEEIFSKPKSKTILIRVDREIAEKLEKRNKGSYNAALHDMLDTRPEKYFIDQVKEHEERLDKIEDILSKFKRY